VNMTFVGRQTNTMRAERKFYDSVQSLERLVIHCSTNKTVARNRWSLSLRLSSESASSNALRRKLLALAW
jgi:hypothetical protein